MKDVAKTFRLESGTELRVLQDLNFSIYADDVVALLGPSGSGKSTCLRLMSGLLEPSSGEVQTKGQKLDGVNLDASVVFQNLALFPWETVYSNIELALKPLRLATNDARTRVKKAIDLVGLEGFEEAYPRELSGGMKQRVGIARALVMERPMLFLDEPFSAIDVLTANALRAEMVEIWMDRKTPTRSMVLVTHSIEEAVSMAKRILVMGTNPGHIRREIINDLPYPRDDQSLAFRRMVAQMHELITETFIPDAPTAQHGSGAGSSSSTLMKLPPREPPVETIPNVQMGEILGLLEAVADRGGSTDIFELAQDTGRDFGSTLYLAKAAELLDLVDTPKHRLILTDIGKRLVDGDINVRKRMLHELFGSLRIVQITTNLLRKNENFRMPVEELRERVEEWLPNENPQSIVTSLINWGRFSEYFGYNDDAKEIYLDLGQETT